MRRLTSLLLLAIVACSTGTADDGFELREWSIDGPTRLPADAESIIVENAEEWPHTLVITTATGEVVAASDLIQPGVRQVLDVSPAPGLYLLSCRIVAQDDEGGVSDHYQRGMSHQLVIGA